MNVPDNKNLAVVYRCNGEEQHEDREVVDDFEGVMKFAFLDVDPCDQCQDYGELSSMAVDRIEFVDA